MSTGGAPFRLFSCDAEFVDQYLYVLNLACIANRRQPTECYDYDYKAYDHSSIDSDSGAGQSRSGGTTTGDWIASGHLFKHRKLAVLGSRAEHTVAV